MSNTFRQLSDGSWGPAIPLPYIYPLSVRCECGRRFFGRRQAVRRRYEDHYSLAHQSATTHVTTVKR